MHIKGSNVNDLLTTHLKMITRKDELMVTTSSTRNGKVLQWIEPVITTFLHPEERVLLNPVRDANPFFHLLECIWMMAGRDDVSSLSFFNSRIGSYSDDGQIFYGAYGHRWICEWGDQIKKALAHIDTCPNTRRATLFMGNPETDLEYLNTGLDVPCNFAITLQLNQEVKANTLNMSVHNRSNDLVWGALGANAVHMSFLGEVIASALGARNVLYHQISDNLHLYEKFFEQVGALINAEEPYNLDWKLVPLMSYSYGSPVERWESFYDDCSVFMLWLDQAILRQDASLLQKNDYRNRWFHIVAVPVIQSYLNYKFQNYLLSESQIKSVAAPDWKLACSRWLDKRLKKKGLK